MVIIRTLLSLGCFILVGSLAMVFATPAGTPQRTISYAAATIGLGSVTATILVARRILRRAQAQRSEE